MLCAVQSETVERHVFCMCSAVHATQRTQTGMYFVCCTTHIPLCVCCMLCRTHTTHMPSVFVVCFAEHTQHTCRFVCCLLCRTHKKHACHSVCVCMYCVLCRTHMPLCVCCVLCKTHMPLCVCCVLCRTHMPLYNMLSYYLIYITT